MTRQILLDLITGPSPVPLILNLANSILLAVILLALGLRILKTEMLLKTYLPGALILGSFNVLLKPLISVGFVTFLLPIVSCVLLLKLYSKSRIIICSWVSFLLLITSTLGPLLIITPLANTNEAVRDFFFKNSYGMSLNPIFEALGPAVILVMFSLFKIEIIPSPGQLLNRFDFYDIYLYLGLVYFCYRFSIFLWAAAQKSSRLALLWPLIDWLVSGSMVVVYYLKKVHDQKKKEGMAKKFEEAEAELKAQIDELATINSQGKSIEVKVLYDILDDFNHKTKNITKMILKAIKTQTQPPCSNSNVHPGDLDPREKKIARLIAMGKSNKEIGAVLDIAEGTAKVLVAALQKKLGLEGREQIAVYAALNNLLDVGNGDSANEMKVEYTFRGD